MQPDYNKFLFKLVLKYLTKVQNFKFVAVISWRIL